MLSLGTSHWMVFFCRFYILFSIGFSGLDLYWIGYLFLLFVILPDSTAVILFLS